MPKAEEKKEPKGEGEKPVSKKKKCFLICPIGDPGSIEWKRSGQLEEFILKPALGDEYEITRADKIPDPGMIPPQIVERLIDDDLVIADLTDTNPNVFYELAVRHAIQKPFIHLMEETQLRARKIPFDNAPMRTIPYPEDFDADKTKDCRKQIREAVRAAVANPEKLHSPISIAKIDKIILDLKSSGGPRDEIVGQIFEMLKEMQARLPGQHPVFSPSYEELRAYLSSPHPYLQHLPPSKWTIRSPYDKQILVVDALKPVALKLTQAVFDDLQDAEEAEKAADRMRCNWKLLQATDNVSELSDKLHDLKDGGPPAIKHGVVVSALLLTKRIEELLSSAAQTSKSQKRRAEITRAKELTLSIRDLLQD